MMNRLYARHTMFGGTDRACAHCGGGMVIDRRSDARYCSPRCRVAAYRACRRPALTP
jgi:hypothetical protein